MTVTEVFTIFVLSAGGMHPLGGAPLFSTMEECLAALPEASRKVQAGVTCDVLKTGFRIEIPLSDDKR